MIPSCVSKMTKFQDLETSPGSNDGLEIGDMSSVADVKHSSGLGFRFSSGNLKGDVTTAAESCLDRFSNESGDSDSSVEESDSSSSCVSPQKVSPCAAGMPPNVVPLNVNEGMVLSSPERIEVSRTKTVVVAEDLSQPMREFSDKTDPDVIIKICKNCLPAWQSVSDADVVVSKIMSGLTNQLFSVQIKNKVEPQRVLFRIYGKDVGELYDSSFELDVFKTLAKKSIAPQLLGEFSGGRIEEWIDGAPLAVEDARNENVLVGVAKLLGRLHSLQKDEDFPKQWSKSPTCRSTLRRWADQARNIVARTPADHPMYEAFQSLNLEEFLPEVALLKERVVPSYMPPHAGTALVFSHNDTQENNVMRVRGGDCLRLIDFEYAGFNYAAYDFANFFLECTIDYTHPVYPFYKITEENYPSLAARTSCACSYLSEVLGRPVTPSECDIIDPFLESVERFRLVSHLIWGFWSVIRAPQSPTFEDFDYVAYSKERFACYRRHLQNMFYDGTVIDFDDGTVIDFDMERCMSNEDQDYQHSSHDDNDQQDVDGDHQE